MAFSLPDLPYEYDALEPHIDARTMEIHHSKHHNTYITNVNTALEDPVHGWNSQKQVEDLIADLDSVHADSRTAVQNNGGGHANHSLFWTILGPGGGIHPEIWQALSTLTLVDLMLSKGLSLKLVPSDSVVDGLG